MKMTESLKSKLKIMGQWFAFMGTTIGVFYFFTNQTFSSGNKLDASPPCLQRTIQKLDERSDILHQEFIDLL